MLRAMFRRHSFDIVHWLKKLQLASLTMWGLLFAAYRLGLGQSFKILDDVKVSSMQQVGSDLLSGNTQ